jgi:hypothetical protein
VTEAETYIDEQLASELRPGESIQHRGYLETIMKGSILSAIKAKGYLTALTDQRLFLIQTKVGAFKPYLDNKGVTAYELDEVEVASVNKRMVVLVTRDGTQRKLIGKHHKAKHLPGLDALLAAMTERWGQGEGAGKLVRNMRVKQIVFGVVVVAIVIAIGIYRSQRARAKVEVKCLSGMKGVGCTVRHVSGGADAKACFRVVFDCENGKHPAGHKCAVVHPGGEIEVVLPFSSFSHAGSCDKATAVHVRDVKVTEP